MKRYRVVNGRARYFQSLDTAKAYAEDVFRHSNVVLGITEEDSPRKRTEPYSGPFPRKKHSHRCKGCEQKFYQLNAVACYKSHCTKPQLVETCSWCAPLEHAENSHAVAR